MSTEEREEALRKKLRALGADRIDGRWGEERLQQEIDKLSVPKGMQFQWASWGYNHATGEARIFDDGFLPEGWVDTPAAQ